MDVRRCQAKRARRAGACVSERQNGEGRVNSIVAFAGSSGTYLRTASHPSRPPRRSRRPRRRRPRRSTPRAPSTRDAPRPEQCATRTFSAPLEGPAAGRKKFYRSSRSSSRASNTKRLYQSYVSEVGTVLKIIRDPSRDDASAVPDVRPPPRGRRPRVRGHVPHVHPLLHEGRRGNAPARSVSRRRRLNARRRRAPLVKHGPGVAVGRRPPPLRHAVGLARRAARARLHARRELRGGHVARRRRVSSRRPLVEPPNFFCRKVVWTRDVQKAIRSGKTVVPALSRDGKNAFPVPLARPPDEGDTSSPFRRASDASSAASSTLLRDANASPPSKSEKVPNASGSPSPRRASSLRMDARSFASSVDKDVGARPPAASMRFTNRSPRGARFVPRSSSPRSSRAARPSGVSAKRTRVCRRP